MGQLVGKCCSWDGQLRLVEQGQRCSDCTCRSIPCQGQQVRPLTTTTRYSGSYRRPAQTATAGETYAEACRTLDALVAEFNRVGPGLARVDPRAVERYSMQIQRIRGTLQQIAERNTAERAEKMNRAVAYATSHHTSYSAACAAIGVAE